MTNKEVVAKSVCPTCGASRGHSCSQGAGRLRAEPHYERKTTATGGVLGSIMAIVRTQINSKSPK